MAEDVTKYVPLKIPVNRAATDLRKDIGVVEREFTHWGARGLEKLTDESIRSGKRFAILHVNPNTNSAVLPCDFQEDLFVGYIDECTGEKVPLRANSKIVNDQAIQEIPCEEECEAKCDCCFPKQLCSDLQTTEETEDVIINGTPYKKTVTSTLMESGEYYVETRMPFWDTVLDDIGYRTKKEYVTKFDLAECGCIKTTADNTAKLKAYSYDCYCCYCSPACSTYKGGYQLFPESGIIKFDRGMKLDRVYMEWRGNVPRLNGQYVVPAVAVEALTAYIIVKDGQYNKSLPLWERRWRDEQFDKERGNMERKLGRVKLSTIVDAVSVTPKIGAQF